MASFDFAPLRVTTPVLSPSTRLRTGHANPRIASWHKEVFQDEKMAQGTVTHA